MKTIRYYAVTKDGQSFNISHRLKRDFSKKEVLEAREALEKKVMNDYKNQGYDLDRVEMLVTVPSKISKSKLNEIGYDIASLWGAECTSIKTYENLVEFNCIEHGERFKTYMSYDEIKEDYHIN